MENVRRQDRSRRGRRHTPPFNRQTVSMNDDSRPLPKRQLISGQHNVVSKTPSPSSPEYSPVFASAPPARRAFQMPPLKLQSSNFFTKRTKPRCKPDFALPSLVARTSPVHDSGVDDIDGFDDEDNDFGGLDIFADPSVPSSQATTTEPNASPSFPLQDSRAPSTTSVPPPSAVPPPGASANAPLDDGKQQSDEKLSQDENIDQADFMARRLAAENAQHARRAREYLRNGGPDSLGFLPGNGAGPRGGFGGARGHFRMNMHRGGHLPLLPGHLRVFGGGAASHLIPSSLNQQDFGRGRGRGRGRNNGRGRGLSGGRGFDEAANEYRSRASGRSSQNRNQNPSGRVSKALYYFANIDQEQPFSKRLPLTGDPTFPEVGRLGMPMIFFKAQGSSLSGENENGENIAFEGFEGGFDPSAKAVLRSGKFGILRFPLQTSFFSTKLSNTLGKFMNFENGRFGRCFVDREPRNKFLRHCDVFAGVQKAVQDGGVSLENWDPNLPKEMEKFSVFIARDSTVIEPSGVDYILYARQDAGFAKLLDMYSEAFNEKFNGILYIHQGGILPYGLSSPNFYPKAAALNKVSFQSLSCARSLPSFTFANFKQGVSLEMQGGKHEFLKLHGKTQFHAVYQRKLTSNPVITHVPQPIQVEGTRVTSTASWFFVERRTRDIGEPIEMVPENAPSW